MSKTIYLSEKNAKYLEQTYPGTNFGEGLKILISHNIFLQQENIKLKQEVKQLKNGQLMNEQLKNEKLKQENDELNKIISTLRSEIFIKLFSNPNKETSKPPEPPKIEKTPIQQFFENMREEKNDIIAEYEKMGMYHPQNIKRSLEGILLNRLKKFNINLEDIQNLLEYKEVIGCEPEFKKLQEEYNKKYGYNDSI